MENKSGQPGEARFHEQFARLGKALGSPKRIELLQVLCQGERSVEALATATGTGVANTSSHLQVLRQAGLLDTRKDGTKVFYRLADDEVARFLFSLRDLARSRIAEVERLLGQYLEDEVPLVTTGELTRLMEQGRAVVLDVRPAEEYAAGHVRGAICIPLEELEGRLDEIAADRQVVVYCRGPYSTLSLDALRILRRTGVEAARLDVGYPEWRLAGGPVERKSGKAP